MNNEEIRTRNPRVLIGATGSVAVTRLPDYLTELRARLGGTYTVLMTYTATQFLPAPTVAIHAERVINGESPADWPTDKPSVLATAHDIVLVLPATANMLAVAAAGAAPNRLATIVLATTAPVLWFPSMGGAMWEKPAVRRNVKQIRADGGLVPEPDWHSNYDLATDRMSHHPTMPSPADVVKHVAQALPGSDRP